MRRHLCIFLALTAPLAAACDGLTISDGDSVKGSGTIVTETRDVSGFNGVEVVGSGDVTIEVTGAETLAITADDNLLPLLTSDVLEDTLQLGVEPDTSISPSAPIGYRITVVDIAGLSVFGSADFSVTGIDAASFGVDIAGSGNVELEGSASSLAIDIRGSGDVDGAGLTVGSASVDISGSGDVVVNATDELDVSISGLGNVEYIGSPAIDQSVSGSGQISQR